jgi:glycosyltransferase involved in cell wall biosynthesis
VTIDVVVPTIGRSSLEVLLAALADAGPLPGWLIVADDRPVGAAADLCRRVPAALDGSTRIVRSGGRGPAAARNAGWRASEADWIAFLDDDVVPDAGWLANLHADLDRLPAEVAASQGRLRVRVGARPTDWERSVAGLADAAFITADMAFRRSALEAARGFDERFPRAYREDAEIACRLLGAGWQIVRGARTVAHPVPAAGRLVSVRRQRGNADDVLMRALHGPRWRELARAPRGARRRHLATPAAGLTALVLHRRAVGRLALLAWIASTGRLTAERVAPGPRSADELATMTVTSALLPVAASASWLAGVVRWRLLRRPAPLPTESP